MGNIWCQSNTAKLIEDNNVEKEMTQPTSDDKPELNPNKTERKSVFDWDEITAISTSMYCNEDYARIYNGPWQKISEMYRRTGYLLVIEILSVDSNDRRIKFKYVDEIVHQTQIMNFDDRGEITISVSIVQVNSLSKHLIPTKRMDVNVIDKMEIRQTSSFHFIIERDRTLESIFDIDPGKYNIKPHPENAKVGIMQDSDTMDHVLAIMGDMYIEGEIARVYRPYADDDLRTFNFGGDEEDIIIDISQQYVIKEYLDQHRTYGSAIASVMDDNKIMGSILVSHH